MNPLPELLSRFNPQTGEIAGAPLLRRHLSDLRGCFLDSQAYAAALAAGDPLVYTVASQELADGPGDLHFGIGRIMPGRVGAEYYLTKGHLHARRDAAEVYIGLAGEGLMLLEGETGGETQLVPLRPNQAVYVPGHTAHRTINIGPEPLVYLGVYPAQAGHDYAPIAERNFRQVVLERNARPVLLDRATLLGQPGENPERTR
jgi:glucose-6-phosphate isomerase